MNIKLPRPFDEKTFVVKFVLAMVVAAVAINYLPEAVARLYATFG